MYRQTSFTHSELTQESRQIKQIVNCTPSQTYSLVFLDVESETQLPNLKNIKLKRDFHKKVYLTD